MKALFKSFWADESGQGHNLAPGDELAGQIANARRLQRTLLVLETELGDAFPGHDRRRHGRVRSAYSG